MIYVGWWGATEWWAKQCVKYLHFLWASTEPNCCFKCYKNIGLGSHVIIYNHIQLRQQLAEPITDNQGTHGCLIWLTNQPQQKQTEQFLALIHIWIVSTYIDMAIEWWQKICRSWNGVLTRPFWKIWSHLLMTHQRLVLKWLHHKKHGKILKCHSYLSPLLFFQMKRYILVGHDELQMNQIWSLHVLSVRY